MPGDPIGFLIGQISGAGGGGAGGGGSGGGSGGGAGSFYKLLYDYWVLKFGLNRPLYIQYLVYLQNIFTFSFGPSIAHYPADALGLVLEYLPWSLMLLVPAVIVGWTVGNYLGAAAAYRKGIYDKILYPFSLLLSNAPYYWFALILIAVLFGTFRIFPAGGAYDVNLVPSFTSAFVISFLLHYTLPFLSLVIPHIGMTAIGMRSMTLYEIGSDYMEYSESLGLQRGKLLSYARKNAILPQFSGLPMLFGTTLAGQVVMEVVFGYPGIGLLLYNSIMSQNYNVMQAVLDRKSVV